MQQILPKDRCCGCAACINACSHNAITMQLDEEGFEYPHFNQNKCVDCGLCQEVCPVLQYEKHSDMRKNNNDALTGFVARNKSYDQRIISSSGSIFPIIAQRILEQGGIVVGVAFDDEWNAVHKIIEDPSELYKLQGSKYLQCKADNETFRTIRKELNHGRKVLYAGLACQVEGLKSFLKEEYENLYTIDLICMGIPSFVVWQTYLKTFFSGKRITNVNFKEKSIGWDSFCFSIDTDKGTFKERGMQNSYLRSMFLSWNMRPSCFNCPFKKVERISDFTLADAWGVSIQNPQINDNKGLSSVIIHSKKGFDLWEEISDKIESVETTIDAIAEGNSNLISNKSQSGDRKLFYTMLSKNPKKAFKKLCSEPKPSLKSRITQKIKSIIKKTVN